MSAYPSPVEHSRHDSEFKAHRTMRWLQEAREGERAYEVEFNPMRDPEHPFRVLSLPYPRVEGKA